MTANPYRAEHEIDTGEGVVKTKFNFPALQSLASLTGQDPIKFYNSKVPNEEGTPNWTFEEVQLVLKTGVKAAGGDWDKAWLLLQELPLTELQLHALVALGRGLIRPAKVEAGNGKSVEESETTSPTQS